MGILYLDQFSDSCAVMAHTTSRDVVEALGGSIDGSGFESDGDDFHYCMVGMPWDDDPDGSDDEWERAWTACVDACEAAGVEWEEVG